jgi:beta-ureidopropionase / N-carbamoyl-L-amino-acid hydrolase
MRIQIDKDRFIRTMQEQAEIGGTENGGLHRLALSDEDKQVRDWFLKQMKEADLETRVDEFGNMFGRREGTDPNTDPLLIGSHLDSQPNGGIYDGALGVIGALEFVRTLNDKDIKTKHPVEIVNWTNEEGSRFQPAMQGSGVWVGEHDLDEEYAKTDTNGATVESELERIGYKGEHLAKPHTDYEAYLELHVEQGPYLELEEKDVGIVTGIVGFTWGMITYYGSADHSGPTPMHSRSDALVAAADAITQIRRIPSMLGERTVGTTGYISAEPNSINIIPNKVTFTWDLRNPDNKVVEEAYNRVISEAEMAAEREGVDWECEERMRAPSVSFADKCVKAVETAVNDLGYDGMHIASGAGHDATYLAEMCDTGMVFAVSEDGKSHSENEYTSWDDCYVSANTFANAALNIVRTAS